MEGAYFDLESDLPFSTPSCSTGECQWHPYGSIGVCSQVVNATGRYQANISLTLEYIMATVLQETYADLAFVSNITDTQPRYHAVVYPVPAPADFLNASISQDLIISELAFAYTDTPVLAGNGTNFTALVENFQFLDVTWSWCIKSLNSTFSSGSSSTVELSSSTQLVQSAGQLLNAVWNEVGFSQTQRFGRFNCPANLLNTTTLLAGGPLSLEEYAIDTCTALLFSDYSLLNSFYNIVIQETDKTLIGTQGDLAFPLSVALFGTYQQDNVPGTEKKVENIERMAGNIARRMTNL
jgi:hypothetical protein